VRDEGPVVSELLCYNLLDMVESSADRGALPAGVGRYEIRSRLAADPLDEVYDAFDPLIERPVAVKVFPLKTADAAAAARVREVFLREMSRAGSLTHPGIVALYDAGEWPGGLFMASELLESQGLAEVLARGVDLDLPLRVSLLVQIVDALEYAHDLGVAHLNLKPSNIHVGPDYMLKVGSFGVAAVADAIVSSTGRRPAPSRHVAPERVRGEAGDFRSDAFSVAQVALDILAGPDRPMPAEGWLTPPALPDALAAHGVRADRWTTLFERALAADPEDRFPSVGAFNVELLMRLELSETEARLAWETSRAIGAFALPDSALLRTIVGTMPQSAAASPRTPSTSTDTTTTVTAEAEAPDLTRGDSETIGFADRKRTST
jgi:serine/threonine protein kinase